MFRKALAIPVEFIVEPSPAMIHIVEEQEKDSKRTMD